MMQDRILIVFSGYLSVVLPLSFSSQTAFPKYIRGGNHLDKHLVAVGCLFLAGKIEDNPKKIQDV